MGSTHSRNRIWAALLASAVASLALAASAGAANKAFLSSFGTDAGAPAGNFITAAGIAVNRDGQGGAGPGDVYVSDRGNNRIQQFSADGAFVRAFGWDVVASGEHDTGANEQQAVTIPPSVTGGTFSLTVTTATGAGVLTAGSSTVQQLEGALGSFHVGDAISGTGIPAATTVTAVGPSTLTLSAAATSGEASGRALAATETTASISWNASAAEVRSALEALPGVGGGNISASGNGSPATPYLVTFSGGSLAGDDVAQMTTVIPSTTLTPSGSAVIGTLSDGGGPEVCEAASSPLDVCKAGSRLAVAGSTRPDRLAIDQATGNLFVANSESNKVDVFSATGQFQSAFGAGVVPNGAAGTGTLATGSDLVTSLVTTSKLFLPGQPLTGAGIPPGTTILSVGVGTLRLSNPATASASGVSLVSPTPAANVAVNERQTVTISGSPTGGTFTLTYFSSNFEGITTAGSKAVVATRNTDGIPRVGDAIQGDGVPSGTTIAAIDSSTGTVTLSANADPGNAFVPIKFLTTSRTTAAIAFNATAAEVQAKLEALPPIGSGNVEVSGPSGGPWTVEFKGLLSDVDVLRRMSATPALTPSGGVTVLPVLEGASETCAAASGCKKGSGESLANNPAKATAGAFSSLTGTGMSIDPTNGHLYVGDSGSLRINEFSFALNGSDEVTSATFVKAFGWKVNASAPAEALQTCTTASGCIAGSAGPGNGQFTDTPYSLAVDSGGFIYIANAPSPCSASAPCRLQKFNPDGSFKETFGPSSGECQLTWTSGSPSDQAAGGVAVDPANDHVFATVKASSTTYYLCEFDSSGALLDRSPASARPASSQAATFPQPFVGPPAGGRVYASVEFASTGAGGRSAIDIFGPAPSPQATILPATEVSTSSARLNGKVEIPSIAGNGFLTSYRFEYSGDGGLSWVKFPASDVSLGSTPGTVDVSQLVTGLEPNRTYRARLVATTSASVTSAEINFKTGASAPAASYPDTSALNVTEATAKLKGFVNPNNQATTYRFEYGTTTSYGSQAPDFDPFLGNEGQPIAVSVNLAGLKPDRLYHYRLVAVNGTGQTSAGDRMFRTAETRRPLNAAGLPDERGYEMVSPPDKNPQGATRAQLTEFAQVAEDGQSIFYPLLGGLIDTDSGGDNTYKAQRSASGWSSTKISTPSLVPSPNPGTAGSAAPSVLSWFSPDLECGFLYTINPLTEDTPVADVELGVANLYRRNPDGTYTLITNKVPSNPELPPMQATSFGIRPLLTAVGSSPDCSKVYFESFYHYLPADSGLYEWDEGVLRDAGRLPDGSTPAPAANSGVGYGAAPGAMFDERKFQAGTIANRLNAVSRDGSRFFFSAISNEPATAGKWATFMREEGSPAVELSRKQGGAKDSLGSNFEAASPDGSHVFFTASYGLTPTSSSGPAQSCTANVLGSLRACDLYDYDVESGTLTNLSATSDPANTTGAAVDGVVAVSDDGSAVYFAARGQLVPGRGKTYAENVGSSASSNLYLARDGALRYVATVAAPANVSSQQTDLQSILVGKKSSPLPSAETTPDGGQLVFASLRNLTGYESGGVREAYLYSDETKSLTCLSCRLDGQPSVGIPAGAAGATQPLSGTTLLSQTSNTRMRKMTDDGRVFFTMPDALVPGAISGNNNIYEWRKGQVYLLATGRPPVISIAGLLTGIDPIATTFYGTTASGDDVFIRTTERLTPYDIDSVTDYYDVRVGGGFAPPPPPTPPCNPAADECQGTPTPEPAAPSPPSANFTGPGNSAAPAPKQKKKHKTKKKHKGKNKKKAKAQQKSQQRAANSNRGGAK